MHSSAYRRSRGARHRAPRPRRRGVLTTGLVLGCLLIVGAFVRAALANNAHHAALSAPVSPSPLPSASPSSPSPSPSPASPSPSPSPSRTASAPATGSTTAGPGTFTYAAGTGTVLGRAGKLRRFRVAVEHATGQDVDGFAATIDQVLGDPRSWIASGTVRLQRVPRAVPADFTIFLATPATSERMCRRGGLDTGGYTSCRLSGKVIINSARWLGSVRGYGAPLAVYRGYAINHEVGHELGHGHERCPAKGQPAPVMQQQTFGLQGCVANAWPYLDGRRYAGPPA